MLKLKYSNWGNTPIRIYKKIVSIAQDESLSPAEQEIAVMAVLCDVDEDVIWNSDIAEVVRLRPLIRFISNIKPTQKKVSKVNIGKYQCTIDYNVNKMNVAQYVDFQNYWPHNQDPEYLARILSVFIIPDGCKYGDGYDIQEIIKLIEDELPFSVAINICFFFLMVWRNSISLSQTYLTWMMKLKRWTTRDRKSREQLKVMEKILSKTQELFGYIS